MKRTIVLLLLHTILISNAYSQIGTRELPSSSTAPKPVVFDSLYGIVGPWNVQKYVGQEIFFLPKKSSAEAKATSTAGYANTFTELPRGYPAQSSRNTYMPVKGDNGVKTNYNALANKYFKVIEVIDKTDIHKSDGGGLYLKLQGNESKDIFYLYIAELQSSTQYLYSEYILAGTFAKIQQRYLNETLYVTSTFDFSLRDLNTDEMILLKDGEEWQCTDVTLVPYEENEVYRPAIILKSKTGRDAIYKMTQEMQTVKFASHFITKTEKDAKARKQAVSDSIKAEKDRVEKAQADKEHAVAKAAYIKKYGEKYGTLIADEKVAIGMTKAMCIEAWGEPGDINTTTGSYGTHEQFVYRNKNAYLYFENGKLTTIQK